MSRFKIALATTNPKTFYILVKILKKMSLAFQSCTIDDQYCRDAHLVITTHDEGRGCSYEKVLEVDEMPDESTTALDIMMHYLQLFPPHEICIGIDPGLHNGVAVLADSTPVFGRVLASPLTTSELVAKIAMHVSQQYSQSRMCIRIGIGSKLYAALLLRELIQKIPDARFEMVDERHTTIQGGYFKDQFSAEQIALRSGRLHTLEDLHLEPKRGFVRGLKHLFSWLTDKKATLSIADAKKILRNEMSLGSALKSYSSEKNSSTA